MLKFSRVVIFEPSNMKRVAFVFCAVLAVALAAEEIEIPRFLKLCSKLQVENDNNCLTEAVQDAMITFSKRSPELGLPVLDPLYIASERMEYNNAIMYGNVIMKNVHVYGVSKTRVLAAKSTASEGRHRLEIDVLLPKVFVEGEYEAQGHFNEFQIGGSGAFNVSMENVRAVYDITGRVENDRWVIEHVRMLPEPEKMKVYFDDIFNGNKNINTAARTFINEYWPIFYKELLPYAADRWDIQFTGYLKAFFSKLSYSKLFA